MPRKHVRRNHPDVVGVDGVQASEQLNQQLADLQLSDIASGASPQRDDSQDAIWAPSHGQIIVGDINADMWRSHTRESRADLERLSVLAQGLTESLIKKGLFEDVASGNLDNPETSRAIVDYLLSA